MVKIKTTETANIVTDFINAVADPVKRNDSFRIAELMKSVTGFAPKMWGPTIVGFGSYHYKYDSGHEGDMPLAGFSPRAAAIVFYFCANFEKKNELLQRLGKHKTGKGCIYIKKLADINTDTLKEIIAISVKHIERKYPSPGKK